MKTIHEEKIQAIIPKYTPFGDITYIFTRKNSVLKIHTSLRTTIKNIYDYYTIDFRSQGRKFRKQGIYQNPPLVFDNSVFVKIKVRKPITKSDGAYGYINLDSFDKVVIENGKSYLLLKDGLKLKFLDSKSTLSKNLLIGQEIKNKLGEN